MATFHKIIYIDLNKLMCCHLNCIERCKKYQKFILGGCLKRIHKNNSYKVLNEDQVLKWPLFYNNNI